MKLTRTLVLTLATATGLSLASGIAGAESDGWIHYRVPVLADAQQVTIQGALNERGVCEIPMSSELSPTTETASIDEIAHNPDTCTSKVLVSSTEVADEAESDTDKSEGAATPQLSAGVAGDANIQAVTRSRGYYKSYYEDPVQLDVNSVSNWTEWSWNGSSVLSSPGPTGGYNYGWYSPSGWSKKENNWTNTYTSAQTSVSSYVHYRNGSFCATIDTHTYYNRNNVHGRKNGVLAGNVSAEKSGGCTRLLSFHTKIKRTKN
ncbi:hypothetical protein JOF56_004493 [Kibdelosporangium banguiense]|uniref:Secreted protein n=1 Tax=Kibdelosporangium banguiense TaxID=1365924 RepID=A0ABS4TI52_9PSEU|nr:hypothetical protein [Kibdelosporangium banguiense]MBP2324108.1 hypothetical protein [Kibdelosporangium banguiense]